MLSGYVYVDMAGQDIGSYVRDAQKAVREKVKLPPDIPGLRRSSMNIWSRSGED